VNTTFRGRCTAALLVVASLLVSAGPSSSARPNRARADDLTLALRRDRITEPQYALERARTLFRLDEVRDRYGFVRAPRSRAATSILQDLSAALPSLSGSERREAAAYFARPSDGAADPLGHGYELSQTDVRHVCWIQLTNSGKKRKVCLHWATKTADAPPSKDSDGDGIPDQVELTRTVLRKVWKTEVNGLRYRAPRRDDGAKADQGPNRGLDVYLVDVGAVGLYGYCTTDEPKAAKKDRVYAYCVLDDDFSRTQFEAPNVSGVPALKVAAAHEFFHAVQFAYEYSNKDRYLKEGTAAWIEDEVYDGVNDNYRYLEDSALHQPEVPLNAFQGAGDGEEFEYGSWIFWRFLSEYLGTPNVIREIWKETAPSGGADPSALSATRTAIKKYQPVDPLLDPASSTPFKVAFAEFGVWVFSYDRFFEEGQAYFEVLGEYPPFDAVFVMSPGEDTGVRELLVDHLSRMGAAMFSIGDQSATLRLTFDLPPRSEGSEASLHFCYQDPAGNCSDASSEEIVAVPLDSSGDGVVQRTGVANVAVILTNANGTLNDQPYRYRAELLP
jgi:hypothetical protein